MAGTSIKATPRLLAHFLSGGVHGSLAEVHRRLRQQPAHEWVLLVACLVDEVHRDFQQRLLQDGLQPVLVRIGTGGLQVPDVLVLCPIRSRNGSALDVGRVQELAESVDASKEHDGVRAVGQVVLLGFFVLAARGLLNDW